MPELADDERARSAVWGPSRASAIRLAAKLGRREEWFIAQRGHIFRWFGSACVPAPCQRETASRRIELRSSQTSAADHGGGHHRSSAPPPESARPVPPAQPQLRWLEPLRRPSALAGRRSVLIPWRPARTHGEDRGSAASSDSAAAARRITFAPVLESPRRRHPRSKSTSSQRSPRISPRRAPVRRRSLIAAVATQGNERSRSISTRASPRSVDLALGKEALLLSTPERLDAFGRITGDKSATLAERHHGRKHRQCARRDALPTPDDGAPAWSGLLVLCRLAGGNIGLEPRNVGLRQAAGEAGAQQRSYVPLDDGAIGFPTRQFLVRLLDRSFAKVEIGEFSDRLSLANFLLVLGRVATIENRRESLVALSRALSTVECHSGQARSCASVRRHFGTGE